MKKEILRIICFICLFVLLFTGVQAVFTRVDNSGVTVAQFYNEPVNSLDVLILGSSEIRASLLPPVIWERTGIAVYNFGMEGMSAAAHYFLLKEALKYQSPSVVVVSEAHIFHNFDIDYSYDAGRLRQVIENMRWSSVKIDAIREIVSTGETHEYIEYIFPLFAYHDRRDITKEDFKVFHNKMQRNLYMGVWSPQDVTYEKQTHPGGYVETDREPQLFTEYLTRIIDLCKEEGIEVVMVKAPICIDDKLYTTRHREAVKYADEKGIAYLDFNSPELYNAIGFDDTRDFHNRDHTNLSGGKKVSVYLADYLKTTFNFTDRREGQYDPHWDDVTALFYERYEELVSKFPD